MPHTHFVNDFGYAECLILHVLVGRRPDGLACKGTPPKPHRRVGGQVADITFFCWRRNGLSAKYTVHFHRNLEIERIMICY